MVGHDGHRGWVYYVAVDPEVRRPDLGRAIMRAAEDWLRERGAVKVQLMVRATNSEVIEFYERLGYKSEEVTVMSRWLESVRARGRPRTPTAGAAGNARRAHRTTLGLRPNRRRVDDVDRGGPLRTR